MIEINERSPELSIFVPSGKRTQSQRLCSGVTGVLSPPTPWTNVFNLSHLLASKYLDIWQNLT